MAKLNFLKMCEQNGNTNKDTKTKVILELTSKIIEMKNLLERFKDRFEQAEGKNQPT